MPPAIGHGVGMGFDGGRPFIPTDFPGCKLWLPAEQGISLLSPSTDRARWLDRSGQFSHVNQTVAGRKPGLVGKKLRFTGATNEQLIRGALASIDNGYTIGIALRIRTLDNWKYFLRNGSGVTGLFLQNGGGFRRVQHPTIGNVNWGACTINPERWIARHDGVGGSADFCLNGVHQTPQVLGNNVPPLASFNIGENSNIDVDAAYLYPTRLNDADTILLDNQLAALQNDTTPPGAPGTPDLALYRPDWYSGQAVTDWANQGTEGALRNIAQALVAKQMVLIPKATPAGGPAVHGDGVDDFLNGAWVQAQPVHQFAAALVTETDVANATMVDGGAAANTARMYRSAAANLGANAGALLQVASVPTDWHRLEAGLNGASSRFRVDDLAPATGNLGAATTGGLTVGAQGGGGGSHADGLIAEIIRYARPGGLLSTAEQDQLHAYLARHKC